MPDASCSATFTVVTAALALTVSCPGDYDGCCLLSRRLMSMRLSSTMEKSQFMLTQSGL
jgi:hypothetical protein